jgi:hypothetical protein
VLALIAAAAQDVTAASHCNDPAARLVWRARSRGGWGISFAYFTQRSRKCCFVHTALFDARRGEGRTVFYLSKPKTPGFSEEFAQSAQIAVDSFFNYLYYLPQTAPFDSS